MFNERNENETNEKESRENRPKTFLFAAKITMRNRFSYTWRKVNKENLINFYYIAHCVCTLTQYYPINDNLSVE